MNQGQTVFAQVLDWIHPELFRRCLAKFPDERTHRTFSGWDQFLCLLFAQMTYRESLGDIINCLQSRPELQYALGLRGHLTKSTLAYANEHRDWRVYAALGQHLITKARRLYAQEDLGLALVEPLYAFDSTTVDLCLNLFPWAFFRSTKSAVKLHTLLDLRGPIPCFVEMTAGARHDVNLLDDLPLEPGSIYVMDRGYTDFARLHRIHQAGAFFVIRAKCNVRFYVRTSSPVDRATGLRCDQTIRLNSAQARRDFPDQLRRVRYFDAQEQRSLVFLTNHFVMAPLTVAAVYKKRWAVETFFRWIKGHLRIKAFYGTSVNAVKTQLWVALCFYLLVAILRKELALPQSLHEILQILSVNAFSKEPLLQLFTKLETRNEDLSISNQLTINGF